MAPPPPANPLRAAQDAWFERLLDDTELSDAVALVGPAAQRVPIHRALLANVSDPLRKALYGDFREGQTREVVLPHVDESAFRIIQRVAAGLAPRLEPGNVVPTLQAAEMYMITELADLCRRYMQEEIGPDGVLTVLTACLTFGYKLPEELERGYWCTILLHSEVVLRSASFLTAHGSIVLRLVKLDEFGVHEDQLWSRLVEWAANAKNHTHIIEPLLNEPSVLESSACSGNKRRRTEGDRSAEATDHQAAVLEALSPHIRFPIMDKVFFADNAMKFLPPEVSNIILLFHLLGRPTPFGQSRRKGLPAIEHKVLPLYVVGDHQQDAAQKLPQGNAAWQLRGGEGKLKVSIPPTSGKVIVTRIILTFASERCWTSMTVYVPESNFRCTPNSCFTGKTMRCTMQKPNLPPPAHHWEIVVGELLHCASPSPFATVAPHASLEKLEVFGILSPEANVASVVALKAAELLVAPCIP